MNDLRKTQTRPATDLAQGHAPQRRRRIVWSVIVVGGLLLVANLGAIVDTVLHPAIDYFDTEHLIVGLVSAFVVGTMIAIISVYVRRIEKTLQASQQSEEALRQSEASLRAIFDNSLQSFMLIDRNRVVQALNRVANERATAIYGREIQPGDSLYRFIQPSDQAGFNDLFERVLVGESVQLERSFSPGGSLHWYEYHVAPVRADEGAVTGVFLSMHDITERKQAEDALRASESLYESLVEVSPLSICRKDRAGHFTFANRRFLEDSNITLADLVGKTDFDLHPSDLAEKYQSDDRAVIASGQVMELVEERTLIGHEPIVVQTIKAPVYDGAGNVNGVQIAFWDITARQHAEEQRQRYEFIVNTATEFMTLINRQHVLKAANDAYCRAQGRSRAELVGRSLAEVWGEAPYREKILPHLEQCFAGRSVHYEDTFAFNDDEPRFYQVGMYPYTAASGEPVMYAAVVTVDVTERVRAEAALRDLNAVLSQRLTEQLALLKATAAISSSLDIDTILQQVAEHMGAALNVSSVSICGWEPATGRSTVLAEWWGTDAVTAEKQGVVGMSYDVIADFGDDLDQWLLIGQPFISQVDDPQLYEPARQHMRDYGGRSALTVPLVVKGRSIGYAELWESRTKREFRSDDIVLAQAIAQQAAVAMENAQLYDQVSRHAEELEEHVRQRTRQLSEANARLSELDRLKDDFISRISHELRTPLTSIKIYLELLETGKPEKHARYMQVLNEQTERLQRLIESLLEVTQKSANTAGLHVAPTDLNHLAGSLVADAAPRALQHGLTLTSQLASELPCVSADAILLAQALSNLVTNALNYTPAGGAIDLSTTQVIDEGETWITFAVRDTGPGIAPDELAHLFDRFYRGRAAADYKTPGAGVGLSISRDILTALDGRLTAQSDGVAGHGSTFTAWLRPA